MCTLVQIQAQALIYPASAPYQAAARYAPMVTDAFTHAVNPATLSGLSGFCAGVNVENRFLGVILNLVQPGIDDVPGVEEREIVASAVSRDPG